MLDSTIISLLKEMKENCLKADFYKDPKRNDKAEALNYAIFIIESMGSRNEQVADKWIKCSDKLPKVNKEVLVTDGESIYLAELWEDGYGFVTAGEFMRIYNVTHWMPPPKLPKECEFSCGNCKHFYYCEIAQGGSCWGEANVAKKRNADDKICELFISNK